jgi:Ca-activated chloride channel family protein
MKPVRLVGGAFAASLLLILVVSAFAAQQPAPPPPPKQDPGIVDPGFAGQPGPQPKLTQQQLQEYLNKVKQNAPAVGGPNPPGPAQPAGAPEAFASKEGKKGWRVTIPGNRPIATPAVADNKIFLGGGFGSHEFYSLDAKTGKQLWLYQTGDDGPTAAVIADELIAFNTESCELEIITMEGKRLWKKWLGDPLMSMPAISEGRVYMAYPDSKGGGGHKLASFDLKTGKEYWKKPISGEIITAPVIDKGNVYLTTLDGTVYNFACKDGDLVWSEKKNATSSPAVADGKLYYSLRNVAVAKNKEGKEVKQQQESLAAQPAIPPSASTTAPPSSAGAGGFNVFKDTTRDADYLDATKRNSLSLLEKTNQKYDGTVGFGGAGPATAKLWQASGNLGQGTVCGVWAYQGSRPFIYKDRCVSSMGDVVKCVDPKTEKVLWRHSVRDEKKDKGPLVDAALTPPAIVNRKLFVGTSDGRILCLSAEDGKELWRVTVGDPILFQPAIAYGHVFVGTANGRIYCIETGDDDDHGWMMWGGNACHNGRVQ